MTEIKTYDEFFDEVGLVLGYDELRDMDIVPDSLGGFFDNNRGEDLRSFCFHNPEFHIVTYMMNNNYLNRYSQSGVMYFLADRNADPSLFYIERMTESEFLELIKNCLATHSPSLKRRMFG